MTFILSMLTGLGVGAGGLYIFYLTLVKDLSQTTAQGINFIFFITASLAAATVSLFKRRISFGSLFMILPSAILGALLGCRVASAINAKALSVAFGILVASSGAIGLVKLLKKKNS